MSTLRERVEECERRFPGISRADVARAAGIKSPSVADWFNGKTLRLKLAPAVYAARLWKCDPLWLGEGVGTPNWLDAPVTALITQPSQLPTLAATLIALGNLLKPLDDVARAQVAPLFAALAADPSRANDLAQRAAAVEVSAPKKAA